MIHRMTEIDHQVEAVKIAGDWNKQLTLWATGAVVLSVSFIKDLLGGVDVGITLKAVLITSWVLLVLSIVVGLLAYGGPITGAGRTDFKLAVTRDTRRFSIAQSALFGIGIGCLVVFAACTLPRNSAAEKTVIAASPQHHYRMEISAEVASSARTHRHTLLLDEDSGAVWEMTCAGGTVSFKRVPSKVSQPDNRSRVRFRVEGSRGVPGGDSLVERKPPLKLRLNVAHGLRCISQKRCCPGHPSLRRHPFVRPNPYRYPESGQVLAIPFRQAKQLQGQQSYT